MYKSERANGVLAILMILSMLGVLLLALISPATASAAGLVEQASAVEAAEWYGSYLGGSNYDYGESIAVDNTGNSYVTGRTKSTDFPVTTGAYQATGAGGYDVFITKFSSSVNLIYGTYLGGAGTDYGRSIAVDNAGNVYVTGYTNSTDFPVTTGAYQATGAGGYDVFITKFSSTGNMAYSTYFGGTGLDDANSIAVDNTGNIYITGYTASLADFPVTEGAYQSTSQGLRDAFLAKFNSDGNLVYSTYFGGADEDTAYGIAVDDMGNMYIAGKTKSTNFPTTPDAYQTTYGGSSLDAFVAKFNAAGNLAYSTYLGGSGSDNAFSITMDNTGKFYIAGSTNSTDFPLTADAYQTTLSGTTDTFLVQFSSSGNLVYSTYFGGSGIDQANGIAVDNTENIYITGCTSSTDFPITASAYQTAHGGGTTDAFVTRFGPGGNLAYSTYLGGSGSTDQGSSIAADITGNAYISGYTNSTNFPVTPNSYQTTHGGGTYDAFFARMTVAASPAPVAAFSAAPTSGDAPLTVNFTDESTGTAPLTYAWDFDNDGTPDSTDQNPIYIYTISGIHTVKLTATNAYGSDDEVKTAYITVNAALVAPTAAFTASPTSGTAPLAVSFSDQSTGTAPLTYAWDFDNDGVVDSTDQNPSHVYSAVGTYTVKLTVTNAASSDDEVKTDYITVNSAPVAPTAAFIASPTSGTAPLAVSFSDQSTGTAPLTYAWDFDNDGVVDSTDQNPSHVYSAVGTYTVKLTVANAGGSDDEIKTGFITVTMSSTPAWDLNGDGVCNIGDVVVIGLHWGDTGTPGWIPEDLNNDGAINIGDVVVIGLHWGESW
ncbi:MAG: SBBP repeat-containing protein [Dehalococcoidia bacterium]|nr:SBBP repeat-containing protein [Dehalococcoidia bacterium]